MNPKIKSSKILHKLLSTKTFKIDSNLLVTAERFANCYNLGPDDRWNLWYYWKGRFELNLCQNR